MKGYELLKAISDREIEDGTKIEIKGRFTGDLSGSYFIYNKGCFRFPIYEPDGTKYSDSVEIHDLINYSFEVIEENKEIKENKEIEELKTGYAMSELNSQFQSKINELIRAVNKLNKESEEK